MMFALRGSDLRVRWGCWLNSGRIIQKLMSYVSAGGGWERSLAVTEPTLPSLAATLKPFSLTGVIKMWRLVNRGRPWNVLFDHSACCKNVLSVKFISMIQIEKLYVQDCCKMLTPTWQMTASSDCIFFKIISAPLFVWFVASFIPKLVEKFMNDICFCCASKNHLLRWKFLRFIKNLISTTRQYVNV